jgi:HAD superfamily hydrolase (TIGR01484 family)
MIHHVLATDFDGTLAHDGVVSDRVVDALQRLRDTGRKLILVTGRRLESLLSVFPKVAAFDLVVAENGALLYWPATKEERPLASPPPREFLDALRERGVDSVDVGRAIVATWVPHEAAVLDAIRALGLERQIIFNKGAVMVLPSGLNKAVGLAAALRALDMSPRNTVAVGDAENDESLLTFCEVSAAVANALDSVKKHADIQLEQSHGEGVMELIERLIRDDLRDLAYRPERGIAYGLDLANHPVLLPAFGQSLLVVGGPGGGKSRFVTGFWERLQERGFQSCIIDPEGDYQTNKQGVVTGTKDQGPTIDDALQVISDPGTDCIVNLFSVPKEERPKMFGPLLRALLEYRSRTGRPHWIIVDEAHYVLPANWQPAEELNADELHELIFISAFPDRLADTAYRAADLLVAIDDQPRETMLACLQRLNEPIPGLPLPEDHHEDRALSWHRGDDKVSWFRRIPPRSDVRRHYHEYFNGDLEERYRFHFHGPEGRLNLAAQNLRIFIQLAEGVDTDTWNFHLRRSDYSTWIRDVTKDEELATEIEHVERAAQLDADGSRKAIIDKIRQRYDDSV